MKKFLTVFSASIFIFTTTLFASNYYWVGGTGNWSDYATHWATASGGTVFHVTIPSPLDDVFFDANSFPTTGDTLHLDTTITNCKSMDWSAATNMPVISGGINLQLYGSLILTPNMTIDAQNAAFTFQSTALGNIINTAGLDLSTHYGTSFNFNGTGSWELQSALILQGANNFDGGIFLNNGTLKTNSYPVDAWEIRAFFNNPCTFLLGSSVITCEQWNLDWVTSQQLIMDADSAVINAGSFTGGTGFTYFNVNTGGFDADSCLVNDVTCYRTDGNANTFHNVTMSGSGNYVQGDGNTYNKVIMPGSSCSFSGSNQYDTLIFNSVGQTVNISNGITITVNELQGPDGTCSAMSSLSSGGVATISKPSGTATFNYVRLENISASGGATFIANNSVDAGNVSGITINTPPPQALYWVGGTGNWNDVNHWSTTSGGAGGNCVPNQMNDVFFDANSFVSLTDTVYVGTAIMYCHSMDWNAANNSPTIFGGGLNMQLYGSLILTPNLNWDMQNASISFQSALQGNIINTAGLDISSHYGTSFNFNGTGSWELQSALILQGANNFDGGIFLNNGTLKTNSYPVDAWEIRAFFNNPCTFLLGSSVITCEQWNLDWVTSQQLIMDADSAVINAGSFTGGTGFTYFNVNTGGFDADSCLVNDVTCYRTDGNANTFHNVTMSGSGNYVQGDGNTYNKVIMPGSSCSFSGSNQYDTLIFNSVGQTVNISNGITITVNELQGPDGTCSAMSSLSSGGVATISKPSGTATFNYVRLENISASGGATFIANNSVDAGNVSGITINTPPPQALYWVGGTGNWNDVNHWSTTSGGAGGNCVPNQMNDVFFDANSFVSLTDTVYVGTAIMYCHSMDWSAANNSPTIFGGGLNMQLYGSLILTPNLNWDMQNASISFQSALQGNIINTAGLDISSHYGTSFNFNGTGSWELQSALILQGPNNFDGGIFLNNGTLKTNSYPVDAWEIRAFFNNPCTFLLGSSVITCEQWNLDWVTSQQLIMDADSAVINAGSFTGGTGFTYFNVNTGGFDADSCLVNDVTCYRTDGNANTFHNVTMSGSGNYVQGDGNTYNKVIMPGSSCSFSGSNQFDTLIFNTEGQVIEMSNGITTSIGNILLFQSNPGFPTTLQCNSGNAIITKPSDTVCTDFIYLKNITATGGAIFFAGDHSVDLGGNSGWNWIRCAPLISNVWPGDCNYDLITDNFDLLNIGVAYGDTGYVRPGASLVYTAQPCQDWYYQFINAVNVKHADCDGNGIVDGPDSTAISLNYGQTHPARLAHQDESNTVGAELAFDIPPAIVPGSAVSVPINLGTSADPAGNVYGIAFTVDYDPAFIQAGTMSVDYSGSWVENSSNHLHLEKDFPGAGKTDIAFTRIDHSDISGYGMIATLNFVVSQNASGPFNLGFSHVKVISHNEIEVPIHTNSGNTYVGIEENAGHIPSVVFPNPMTDQTQIFFSNHGHEQWTLTLKDITGRIMGSEKTTTENIFLLERKNLTSGLYFYMIHNSEGKSSEGKIVVK